MSRGFCSRTPLHLGSEDQRETRAGPWRRGAAPQQHIYLAGPEWAPQCTHPAAPCTKPRPDAVAVVEYHSLFTHSLTHYSLCSVYDRVNCIGNEQTLYIYIIYITKRPHCIVVYGSGTSFVHSTFGVIRCPLYTVNEINHREFEHHYTMASTLYSALYP